MRDGFIKVASGTPAIQVANCEYNADAIIELIRRAQNDGVKVLVLPELTLVGYTCGDLVLSTALTEAAMRGLERIVAFTQGSDMLIAVGVPIVYGHLLYNCAAVVQNGHVLGVIPKTHLGNYGEFYEKRTYAAALETTEMMEICGEKVPFGNRLVFTCREMPLFAVGVEICEDLWQPCRPPPCWPTAARAFYSTSAPATKRLLSPLPAYARAVSGNAHLLGICFLQRGRRRKHDGRGFFRSRHDLRKRRVPCRSGAVYNGLLRQRSRYRVPLARTQALCQKALLQRSGCAHPLLHES
jgi:NAD+ synthase (glutamine-hydrolysing)